MGGAACALIGENAAQRYMTGLPDCYQHYADTYEAVPELAAADAGFFDPTRAGEACAARRGL